MLRSQYESFYLVKRKAFFLIHRIVLTALCGYENEKSLDLNQFFKPRSAESLG